jgi:phospholipid/cholesterol/gamma-HCH transport system ATP-binding protein
LAEGTPAQLRASQEPSVRQFIDGTPDGPFKFHYPSTTPLAADFGLGAKA